MIKRSKLFGNKTRVTFCLPADDPVGVVSVVGTFNGWEPGQHELKARRDGTRTISVRLDPGTYSFRYRLQNDGSRRDTINLTGHKWSTPPADCKYKVVRAGRNITRKIIDGIQVNLKSGDKSTYKVTITAEGNDDQCALEFRANSAANFLKLDYAIFTVANTA